MGEPIDDYKSDQSDPFLNSWYWRWWFRNAGWLPEFQVLRSGWLRGLQRDWIYGHVQFKTIVNLAHVPGKGRDRREAKWAAERGIKVINFSWGSGGPPKDLHEPKDASRAVLDGFWKRPIWVHCVAGKDRTGALIAIMQMMRGASWGEILATWKKFGKPRQGWVDYVWRLF